MSRNNTHLFTYYILMVSATLHMHDKMPKDMWQRRIRNLLEQLVPLMENQHREHFVAAGNALEQFMQFNEMIETLGLVS